MSSQWIFTARCLDQAGIVSAVTTTLYENGFFIEEAAQFGDAETGQFFMRLQLRHDDNDAGAILAKAFEEHARRFAMTWDIHNLLDRPKLLLLVSKFDHCLADLLYRYRIGELKVDITAIVSNHDTLRPLAERASLPFHHIPISAETKPEAERRLETIIAETQSDLIVLARYMQILSSEICDRYPAQIINIHHSFLPGFKGAKPYHQAHERGVKIIGATAHYVTSDLDEGPIIEQSVEHVDHSKSAGDLIAIGRDVESRVLAKAVKLHSERRVFLNGIRTVIFQ